MIRNWLLTLADFAGALIVIASLFIIAVGYLPDVLQ